MGLTGHYLSFMIIADYAGITYPLIQCLKKQSPEIMIIETTKEIREAVDLLKHKLRSSPRCILQFLNFNKPFVCILEIDTSATRIAAIPMQCYEWKKAVISAASRVLEPSAQWKKKPRQSYGTFNTSDHIFMELIS